MTLCTTAPLAADGASTSGRPQRRAGRPAGGKRLAASGKVRAFRRSLDPCDNSNDSGLGFDHHVDTHHHTLGLEERLWNGQQRQESKRPRMDIKLEYEDVDEGYSFPDAATQAKNTVSLIRTAPAGSVPPLSISSASSSGSGRAMPRCVPFSNRQSSVAPVPLTTQLSSTSRYSDISLVIVKQPEQQHRARYQTEGSRGAVKDREGNGFPIVKLTGYYKPSTLQVYIGTDVGKVAPHMFYQACKVSGKNSTPCIEKKIEGTCVIELSLEPSKEMSATCDCVGILKERNVDVEHRFPDQLGNRSKKKSTRCRMIFRTTIVHDNGTHETLQVCSQPIACTQPPGVPEVCKKSLSSCPATGGLELFVLGKNFLKDTQVYFQEIEDGHVKWEQVVTPDKEYLQQTHFVCVIPQYRRPDITEPVSVRFCIVSSGKTSESHPFVYTPVNGAVPSVHTEPQRPQPTQFLKGMLWQSGISKREQDLDMMPPPETNLVPLSTRRPSASMPSSSEMHSPPVHHLKQEYIDESSQSSIDPMDIHQERYRHISESSLDVNHGDSNMSLINENSMDMAHHGSMVTHMNENSNISVVNDDSVDIMVRRNSISRPIPLCENSVDVNVGNSNMSTLNEESTCNSVMHCNTMQSSSSMMEKVIDLRMKMPITAADFISNPTTTLERFGIEPSSGPLPAQSGQSVENYLTKIESKPSLPVSGFPTTQSKNQIIGTETNGFSQQRIIDTQVIAGPPRLIKLNSQPKLIESEQAFLNSQKTFVSLQNHSANIVSKQEPSGVNASLPVNTNALSAITTLTSSLERSIPTPINTEKLDDFVNSTVERHIGSPTKTNTTVTVTGTSNKNQNTVNHSPDSLASPNDVLLGSQNSLVVPALLNSRITSPAINQQETSHSHKMHPEVILSSQISPSLMCRSTNTLAQEALLPASTISNFSAAMGPATMISPTSSVPQEGLMISKVPQSATETLSPLQPIISTEPEKAVLLEAAADLLETQKKIDNFATGDNKSPTLSLGIDARGTFMSPEFSPNPSNMNSSLMPKNTSPTLTLPVPAKEMPDVQPSDLKKNEDPSMIPQSFTTLTENELINFINPSCFDQV